jgi:signal transduction histidine kinase
VTDGSELTAARREFARRVNHTLRGDINALRQALNDVRGEEVERFAILERAVARVERRALDIALLTQADAGSLDITRKPCPLGAVVEEAIQAYIWMASDCEVEVVANLDAAGGASAPLDRALIVRAIGALLDNAIRFSPEESVVTVTASLSAGKARVTVRDQGRGFAPGAGAHVFESFEVGAGVSGSRSGRLGLGLSVARAIVLAHSGSIQIVEDGASGGAVAIELPLE